NPYILPQLLDYALEEAKGQQARYLIDAYCGVGVFAIAGSAHFERYKGIEVNANAIRWARGNAGMNNANNGDFVIGEAQHIFADVDFPGQDTALIIDPPRQGCSREFVEQAIQFAPKTIVYVSCDPATQVRDLQWFMEGGYELIKVQPFDLFPQTRHIESVATLLRK
ncbi:MAG TPA: methyltransferase, partial [Opitutales bacterium]|nr:methyltransferase [Opitutales bacterium]